MLAAIAALSAKPVESNGAEHRADGQHDSVIYRDERGLLIFPLKCARYPKLDHALAAAAQGFTFFAITLPDSFSATRNS